MLGNRAAWSLHTFKEKYQIQFSTTQQNSPAILHIPNECISVEAAMWAMLTALALLLTWKWWSNLLLDGKI